jgi:hypothetical protein
VLPFAPRISEPQVDKFDLFILDAFLDCFRVDHRFDFHIDSGLARSNARADARANELRAIETRRPLRKYWRLIYLDSRDSYLA